eukprot:4948303-Lingulodinium_polyedra.AAC.1
MLAPFACRVRRAYAMITPPARRECAVFAPCECQAIAMLLKLPHHAKSMPSPCQVHAEPVLSQR